MAPWPRRVRVTATGHAAVRAAHAKTFEVTADPTLTERGTCIVGVDADLSAFEQPVGLAGPVRITLTAGDLTDTVTALANPFAAPTRRVVVRRSDSSDADTIAGLADRGAADLDRALLDALKDPGTTVTLDVEEAGDTPAENALVALLPPGAERPPGTALLRDVAKVVDRVAAGDRIAVPVSPSGLDRQAADAVTAALESGAVVAVVPGPWQVPPVLPAAGIATPSLLDAGVLTGSGRREAVLLAGVAIAGVPLTARVDAGDLPTVLAKLAEHLGPTTPAAVSPDSLPPYRAVARGTLADLAPYEGTTARTLVLAVDAPDRADQPLPPAVEHLVGALAADGLPVRRLAVAVAAATGWTRQRSYDAVLALRAEARAKRGRSDPA